MAITELRSESDKYLYPMLLPTILRVEKVRVSKKAVVCDFASHRCSYTFSHEVKSFRPVVDSEEEEEEKLPYLTCPMLYTLLEKVKSMGAIEKIGSITTIESMRKENCSPEGIRDCLTEWLSLHPIHLAQNDLRILIQNTAKEARNSNAFARKDKSVRPKTHHFMKGFRKHSSPIRGITSTLGPRETLRKGSHSDTEEARPKQSFDFSGLGERLVMGYDSTLHASCAGSVVCLCSASDESESTSTDLSSSPPVTPEAMSPDPYLAPKNSPSGRRRKSSPDISDSVAALQGRNMIPDGPLGLIEEVMGDFHQGYHVEQIVETVLRKVMAYAHCTVMYLVRSNTKGRMVLDASLTAEKTWSVLQSIPLSQSHLFSRNILLDCECSERPVLFSTSAQVEKAGGDYYQNMSPESLLCIPVLLQRKFMGCLYMTNFATPYAFNHVNTVVVGMIISNLLGVISQSALRTTVMSQQMRQSSQVLVANQLKDTLLQDTVMVYDGLERTWSPQFVVTNQRDVRVYSSPFGTHPFLSLDMEQIKSVHVASKVQRTKKTLCKEWPSFPPKFKAKNSLLLLKMNDSTNYWFGFGCLKMAHKWHDVIRKHLKNDSVSLTIPPNIRVAAEQVQTTSLVGRGGTAVVYDALWNGTTRVAVKRLFDIMDNKEVKMFFDEMAMLHSLRHPNIVLLHGGYIDEAENRPSIVFEYLERGSLDTVLYDPLLEITASIKLEILRGVARALQYLHSFDPPIVHRDLKPGNILISEKWVAKLADFGLARKCDDKNLTEGQGTVKWMAPEVMLKRSYGIAADIYSFGLVMWEIIEQQKIFTEFKFNSQVEEHVLHHHARPPMRKDFPPKLYNIITSCWNADASQRPSAQDVVEIMNSLTESDLV